MILLKQITININLNNRAEVAPTTFVIYPKFHLG
jgi:hypothetical protein